jgi:site-specific recombinase XerD
LDYAWSYISGTVSALRFFFEKTLGRDLRKFIIPCPKKNKKLPCVLSRSEVRKLLTAAPTIQQEAYFTILYGAGLRASEGRHLTLADIDSANHRLWVRQGKGGKDRIVYLSFDMLMVLRQYYKAFPFQTWIFPGVKHPKQPMDRSRAWSWFDSLKKKAGITKKGGPHLLRHSYATHHLENGHDLYTLKKALGHSKLSTTMIYIHLARRPSLDNDSPLDHLSERDD